VTCCERAHDKPLRHSSLDALSTPIPTRALPVVPCPPEAPCPRSDMSDWAASALLCKSGSFVLTIPSPNSNAPCRAVDAAPLRKRATKAQLGGMAVYVGTDAALSLWWGWQVDEGSENTGSSVAGLQDAHAGVNVYCHSGSSKLWVAPVRSVPPVKSGACRSQGRHDSAISNRHK
jgi:hypothetical protein